MPHFLINSECIKDGEIVIDEKELFNHLTRSLRLRAGEKVLFLDENEIQYETLSQNFTSKSAVFKIEKQYKSERKLNFHLALAQSVLKQDAQTSAIQKATELGVKEIIPLYTDNCALKEAFIRGKIEKWQKIAVESVKQCERADIPLVKDLSNLEKVIKEYDNVFVFAEKYAHQTFSEYLKEKKPDIKGSVLVIIGCEGGFSEREFEFFKQNNLPLLTLGSLILRADTACAVSLATVINGIRDYGIY